MITWDSRGIYNCGGLEITGGNVLSRARAVTAISMENNVFDTVRQVIIRLISLMTAPIYRSLSNNKCSMYNYNILLHSHYVWLDLTFLKG